MSIEFLAQGTPKSHFPPPYLLDNLSSCTYIMRMKTLQVGELKQKFSHVLDLVRQGEEITITFGKTHEKVAVIVPYEKYRRKKKRSLGVLQERASYTIRDDFEITDHEFLTS